MRCSNYVIKRLTAILYIYSLVIAESLVSSSKKLINHKQPVMVFDLDSTLTYHGNPSMGSMLNFIYKNLFAVRLSSWFYMLYNFERIKKKSITLALQEGATTEKVVIELLSWLYDQGYADLRAQVYEIVDISINPVIIKPMLALVKKLKKDGYIVVAATAQDGLNHVVYRQKLKQQGIDLDILFDTTLTSFACWPALGNLTEKAGESLLYVKKFNFYMIDTYCINKPNISYFQLLYSLLNALYSSVENIVFIDDKYENIESFNQMIKQANIKGKGIHFKPVKKKNIEAEKNEARRVYNEIQSFMVPVKQNKKPSEYARLAN